MGSTRGPVPKRSGQRRRRNKTDEPTSTIRVGGAVRVPAAGRDWHPRAKALWRAAKQSGQSQFYEPTDWQALAYTCDLITHLFRPGTLTTRLEGLIRLAALDAELSKDERIWLEAMLRPVRPSAQMVASLNSLMGSLALMEGDRRRMRLELERPGEEGEEDVSDAADLDEHRRRLRACD
jgi:hypothetical protein